MIILASKIVISITFLIISGMFDAQKDYAKSSISRFVDNALYKKYPFYFYSGNGTSANQMSGWVFKWKNGKHKDGVAFRGSNTYNVWKTDWFHCAKRMQILFLILGIMVLSSIHPCFVLLYELINHFGFVLATSENKIAKAFMNRFHKFGLNVFLKTQGKHNAALLQTYIDKV
jgi:hypothetical protein